MGHLQISYDSFIKIPNLLKQFSANASLRVQYKI